MFAGTVWPKRSRSKRGGREPWPCARGQASVMASSSKAELNIEDEGMQGMEGGVPKGLFIKLQIAQKNRDAADAVRKQKEDLAALKLKRLEDQAARVERLKQKRATRHAEAKQQHIDHIASVGAEVRAEIRAAEAQRREQNEEHWRQARVRVEHANNLDERLDAAEAAQDAQERQEAADARALLAERAAKKKASDDQKKAMLNAKVLKGRQKLDESKIGYAQLRRARSQQLKQTKAVWASTTSANKEKHLEDAKNRAQRRAAEKADARQRNDERMARRRQAAREEKANDTVATKALEDEIARNRMKRSKTYQSRYVPTAEVYIAQSHHPAQVSASTACSVGGAS